MGIRFATRSWSRPCATFLRDKHELRTARLWLRSTTAADASNMFPLLDDPAMWIYFPEMRPRNAVALENTYARRERGYPGNDGAQLWENWIVRFLGGNTPLGECQATIFPPKRVAFVAYGIARRYQRQGFAKEAVSAVIAHLRAEHGVREIFAEMDARNEASRKLVESLGFTRREERASDRENGIQAEYLYGLG
jgi:ribosomal-protein-alanine N-acetyltransferase